jgi:hypothetical protein
MHKIINSLCKNLSIKSLDQIDDLNEIIKHKEKSTGDNIVIYASRFGNLNLLELLYSIHVDFKY